MNRSKREIERLVEDLERASASVERGGVYDGPLEARYSAEVVDVVRLASVELFRICHRDPVIANGPDREVIGRFLEAVREKYDLGSDRDEAVRETLARATSGAHWGSEIDVFATAPIAIAKHLDLDLATPDGVGLEELVEEGRESEAVELLVATTYDVLASRGGRSVGVRSR